MREAQVAAKLHHSNIVTTHDVILTAERCVIVMEFAEGETLEAVLEKHGPLGPADTIRIVTQVAEALAYAHQKKIVHRDVKPANIMAFILSRIDDTVTPRDVFHVSALSDKDTARTLLGLLRAGIIELDGQPVTEKIADMTKQTTHGMSRSSGPSRQKIEYLFELFQHQNDWQVLGVEPDATPDVIKRAFQKKTFEYHPDRYAELAEPDVRRKLSFLFTRVSEAFATLSNLAGAADVPVSPKKIAPSERSVEAVEAEEETGEERKHANAIFDRAKKAFEERDHLRTVMLCREAIDLASERADYFYLLGLALSQNRKSRLEAEQNLKTASKLDLRNPEYLSALWTLYENEGLRWRARTMFENAHAAVGSYSMADDDLASFLFQDRSSLAAPNRISVSR